MQSSNALRSNDLNEMSLDELVIWLQENESEEGLARLFSEMKNPITAIMYNFYPVFLPLYDIDDMYQEAYIAMWQAIKNFKPEKGWKAKTFMGIVVKRRFIRIHERYYRSNPYILYSTEDDYREDGTVEATLVESSFRERNIEKQREWNNKWRERNGLKPCKPKVHVTPQERKRKAKEYAKKYHEEHKEELKEKYRNRTPEQIERDKKRRREYYLKNRELAILQARLYKEAHPEKAREYARKSAARKKARLAAEAAEQEME